MQWPLSGQSLYWFSGAVGTNYHKLRSFYQWKLILQGCGGQKSEISFTGPALQPPGAVGEALFLASLVAVDTPWLVATSPQSPPLWPHHLFVFCMQYTTLCLSLMRMHVMALKAHLANPGYSPYLQILSLGSTIRSCCIAQGTIFNILQ